MKKNYTFRAVAMVLATTLSILSIFCLPNFTLTKHTQLVSAAMYSPAVALEEIKTNISVNTEQKTVKDNTTTPADVPKNNDDTSKSDETDPTVDETKEAMRSVTKDDISATPSDILQLQKAAQGTIESEERLGSISEAPYTGGGQIIAEGSVAVQTKIPADFYSPNISALIAQGADLSIKDKKNPTVLIYHSHTTEAYQTLDVGYYTTSFMQRREDTAQNMVRVGVEIVKVLEAAGFTVIHDTTIYDKSYSEAYSLSGAAVKRYLEQYPTIDVTIDVHRDAIQYNDGTKVKPVTEIGGKKVAKMMMIAGCEYGSIKNFPDWEHNLRFVMQLQNKASQMYDGLMRPVLFSARRYNMFETHNSLLLEVGSDGNTLEEACYAGRLFGEILAATLEDYIEK